MVFNPSLQGNTRFDQPVQQAPSGMAVLGNVISGLGVLEEVQRRTAGPAAPNNEQDRFNASWQRFTQEIGRPGISPAEATPRELDSYGRFDPARYDTALNIHEQAGGVGRVAEREQRDAFIEFRQSPTGTLAQARAMELYPDDEGQQELYLARQYVIQQETIADHERLQRESEAAGYRGNVSEEAWDIELGNIRDQATNYGLQLRDIGFILINEGRYNLRENNPELAAILGIETLTRDNLESAARTFQAQIMRGIEQQLRQAYPNRSIRTPDAAYFEQAFGPFNMIVDAILDESNPTQRLERLMDATELQTMLGLSEQSRAALTLYERYGNNPYFRDIVGTNAEWMFNVQEDIDGILNGSSFVTPDTADDMSRGDAREMIDLGLSVIQTVTNSRNPSQRDLDDVSGFVASLPALMERTGGQFDVDVYETIMSPNVIRALNEGTFGQESRTQLAQLVQYDLSREFDELRQFTERVDGSLAIVNGEVVFTGANLVGDTGETLGPRALPRGGQEILDRINDKLGVLDDADAEALFGANVLEIFEQDGTLVGPETTGGMIGIPEGQGAGSTGMDNALSRGIQSAVSANTAATAPNDIQVADRIIRSLSHTESRGRFGEFNLEQGAGGQGHFGRLQFSRARLQEAINAGVLPRGTTPEEFLANPAAQQMVEQWHVQDIMTRINEQGLSQYIGQTIRGVPVTMEGLVAVAHLGGFEGMRRFVTSGGSYNPDDAYGTTLMDYFTQHGAGGQPSTFSAPQGATPLAENVWATAGMTPLTSMQGASRMTQPYAEERMSELLAGPFQQLQRLFGGPVTINDAIAREGTSRESETPGSRHFHGDALDLNIAGMSPEEQLRLVRAAYAAGFRGFGFGQGILHVDMGAARSWAYGNDTFGGLPVSELQTWVSTGAFPSDFGMSNGELLTPGQEAFAQGLAAQNAAPDIDPGEGAPTNFTVYEPTETQQVEQEATNASSTTTPEQAAAGQGMVTTAQKTGEVSPEIMDLISQLTGRGDEQAIRELEEFLRSRTIESTTAQGVR